MKITFVSSEVDPFVKTGGLADVSGSLPLALEKLGCEINLFLPFYDIINENKFEIKPVEKLQNLELSIGDKKISYNLFTCKFPGTSVDVYFVDCPFYFHRNKVYTNDNDEDERFILFQKAVLASLDLLKYYPDIIHCNDWQTGLIPAYLNRFYKNDSGFNKTGSVFSIHNIAYQGLFDKSSFLKTNFPKEDFKPFGPFELWDKFCFIKAGISSADAVTTVSPTYAKEIQTPEYGCGLEGVLVNRQKDLYGIINGIDVNTWNPEIDKLIAKNYNFSTIQNKTKNKEELMKFCGLKTNVNTPLIGIVSRFAWQKGFELLQDIMDKLLQENLQIVILGKGEEKYESYFKNISIKNPEKIKSFVEYDNELAHKITAASDIFLMPSKYEPCGLNQMYSLQYGTVPVVRKTGGLADTVLDFDSNPETGNGFTFQDFDSGQFYSAIKRALSNFNDNTNWKKIICNGMSKDFSWDSSAKKYLEIYNLYIK